MPRRIDVGWAHPRGPPAPNAYLVCSTSLLTCPETDKLKPEPVRRSIAARLSSKSAISSLVLRDGSGCTPSLGRALLSGCLVKRPVLGSSKRRSSALTPGLISIAPSVMTDAQSIWRMISMSKRSIENKAHNAGANSMRYGMALTVSTSKCFRSVGLSAILWSCVGSSRRHAGRLASTVISHNGAQTGLAKRQHRSFRKVL